MSGGGIEVIWGGYIVSDFGVCSYSSSGLLVTAFSVPSSVLRSRDAKPTLLPLPVTFPPFMHDMVADEVREMSHISTTVRIVGTNRGLKRG